MTTINALMNGIVIGNSRAVLPRRVPTLSHSHMIRESGYEAIAGVEVDLSNRKTEYERSTAADRGGLNIKPVFYPCFGGRAG